jgi:hypothetical protein
MHAMRILKDVVQFLSRTFPEGKVIVVGITLLK